MIPAPVCGPILSASLSALVLEQTEPLTAALHFLRDFLSYGTSHPNSSDFNTSDASDRPVNPPEIQTAVKQLAASQGEVLVQRVMTGMMFTFPRDCFADASGVLLIMFELMPEQVALWIRGTIAMLPAGTVKMGEADRLMKAIAQKIQMGDMRKIRVLLQGM